MTSVSFYKKSFYIHDIKKYNNFHIFFKSSWQKKDKNIAWVFVIFKGKMEKTKFKSKEEGAKEKKWYLIDASSKILGRFASEIVKILRGKHKSDFSPNVDTGDFVVIINAAKIAVTGSKEDKKEYFKHTGAIGGLKRVLYKNMKPEKRLFLAIKGMMPKTKLARHQMKNLRIFVTEEHNIKDKELEKVVI